MIKQNKILSGHSLKHIFAGIKIMIIKILEKLHIKFNLSLFYMSSKEIYIVRICLLPLRNHTTINNLPVFTDFSKARDFTESFINQHKLTIKNALERYF